MTPADATVESGERIVHEILARDGSQGSELPILKISEPDLGWLEQTIKSLIKTVQDLMRRFFPESASLSPMDIEKIVKFVMWTGAIAISGLLVYFLFRLFSRAEKSGAAMSAPSLPRDALPVDRTALELQAALARGDFARAARLRWRLFLHRSQQPTATTPREFARDSKNAAAISRIGETTIYAIMFGAAAPDAAAYASWSIVLDEIELPRGLSGERR